MVNEQFPPVFILTSRDTLQRTRRTFDDTLFPLHHDMENSGPHYKLNMKHSSSTWGRVRDVEWMSQSFSTCGFPLESKPIPVFHTASLFSSHRELSVIWNRNQLFTSSMCEAAQLHRGNPGECSRSQVQIGSHQQVTSPVLNGELFHLYRINNNAYCPGLSLVEWKEVLYTVWIYVCMYMRI